MSYFRLLDDLSIQGRWHLGEIIDCSSNSALELWQGVAAPEGTTIRAEVTDIGEPLEFCLSSFAVPIARSNLARAIASVGERDLQLIPVDIPGHPGFEILNSIRVIRCLDEQKSKFVKWTAGGDRPDLVGQYRMVTKLIINPADIPPDAQFFRILGWRIALIVSETVKSAMESCGCSGAKFQKVS
jgi:hypothetical protein